MVETEGSLFSVWRMLSKVSSDGLMTTRPELIEWKVGLSDEDG